MTRIAGAIALVTSLALALARPVAADPAADANVARADALFTEAQALQDAGNLEAACAKFDESLALDRQAIGTLLNVARCDARLGKLAHAVALYIEARDRGREQSQARYVAVAEEQIAKLSPLVPHLAIAFAEPIDGMQIVVDDAAVLPPAAADLSLDPGAHHVSISAPGRVPYDQWIKLAKSEHKAMSVPALAYPTTVHTTHTSSRAIGQLATIGGGVLVATGVVLGLVAKVRYDNALSADCPNGGDHCNANGFAATQSARSLGDVGTVVGVIGVAATAVGVTMWWRAPRDRVERGVTFAPIVAPGEAGIAAVGRF